MMNSRPTPTRKRSHARSRAFTIIELVVAMAIASIMIFLINRIFFDTTNAVSRGIGLSQIIGESRAFSSTLDTDTRGVPDPLFLQPGTSGDRGFLFIGFKTYNNIDFANPRRLNGTAIQRNVTSDQLLAVIDIGTQNRTPLTPRDDSTFSPHTPGTSYGLLWYGHVSRLNPDGSDGGELTAGNNRFGHQWIVGRQLMFLENPGDVTGVAHAQGPFSRGDVVNYSNLSSSPIPAAQRARYMGLSDVLNVRLTSDATSPLDLLTAATTPAEYLALVARMAYVTDRLRVASSPAIAPTQFESWNLAQTHPAFMSNCSDFQISFAGNFDSDPGIDVEDTLEVSGGDVRDYQGGSIKWYGYPTNDPKDPNYTPGDPVYDPGDPRYDPTMPAVYLPTSGINPEDPIYDTAANISAEIPGNPPLQVDRAVVFRHDAPDKATQWPHLIRIRYRLHDERGEIESTNGLNREQGIWFEQIIRVQ